MILDHLTQQEAGGHLQRRRQTHALTWMQELISSGLLEVFHNAPAVQERLARLEHSVRAGATTPVSAARELLEVYRDWIPGRAIGPAPRRVPTNIESLFETK